MTEIKPCPFCGSNNVEWIKYPDHPTVMTHHCSGDEKKKYKVYIELCGFDMDYMIEKWNERSGK